MIKLKSENWKAKKDKVRLMVRFFVPFRKLVLSVDGPINLKDLPGVLS